MNSLAPKTTDKKLIRLGPKGDGGYLVPDDLDGVVACFSPGVSSASGFEKDCADLGMKVYLADNSVEKPYGSHQNFHFTPKFIGVTSNDLFMTMDDWVVNSSVFSARNTKEDIILQIDIEGFEYETFLSISDNLMRRFRVIVAEFHGLDQLWNRPFFDLASRAFEKILQSHTCVHIHPNNYSQPLEKDGISLPPLLEFTFLRNDRIVEASKTHEFPHPLDFDNTQKETIVLPKCWYSH